MRFLKFPFNFIDSIDCCFYKLSLKIAEHHHSHRFDICPNRESNGITGYLQTSKGGILSHT
ncbi:hypothetical protein C5167_014170 [Papaver somniferum]|uniref:Uncharacterized protein n=1 Tax=Papaver somniferum TaxID=3469 RepID=A0A4Y7J2E0_PAPSO|nr:hypothetical protein C5167_014170 [Papaver somniferum]